MPQKQQPGRGGVLPLPSQHHCATGRLSLNLLVFIHMSWTRVWRVVMGYQVEEKCVGMCLICMVPLCGGVKFKKTNR